MKTVLAYFDETGDDGLINYSSQDFVLTSICTKAETWKKNYNVMVGKPFSVTSENEQYQEILQRFFNKNFARQLK